MNRDIAKGIADKIVTAITDDMLDRSELQNALEECDDEARDEISATWMKLVETVLHENIS
jgi:hypothetical protein